MLFLSRKYKYLVLTVSTVIFLLLIGCIFLQQNSKETHLQTLSEEDLKQLKININTTNTILTNLNSIQKKLKISRERKAINPYHVNHTHVAWHIAYSDLLLIQSELDNLKEMPSKSPSKTLTEATQSDLSNILQIMSNDILTLCKHYVISCEQDTKRMSFKYNLSTLFKNINAINQKTGSITNYSISPKNVYHKISQVNNNLQKLYSNINKKNLKTRTESPKNLEAMRPKDVLRLSVILADKISALEKHTQIQMISGYRVNDEVSGRILPFDVYNSITVIHAESERLLFSNGASIPKGDGNQAPERVTPTDVYNKVLTAINYVQAIQGE